MFTDDADDLVRFQDVRVIETTGQALRFVGSGPGPSGCRAGTSAASSGAPGIAASGAPAFGAVRSAAPLANEGERVPRRGEPDAAYSLRAQRAAGGGGRFDIEEPS